MKKTDPILRIAIRSPLRQCFDYRPPCDSSVEEWQPGQRLRVPFGRREVIGMLVDCVEKASVPESQLKSVVEVIDAQPILTPTLMHLYQWASAYYHCSLGEVILGTLPALLRRGRSFVESPRVVSHTVMQETALVLNKQQKTAVQRILHDTGYRTYLLQGVTGSGKTEVYLHCIQAVLDAGLQALVLVPEIALTPQTLARFQARFSVPITLMHSELTDKERLYAWCQAAVSEPQIVIGTRSAVFAPLSRLGLLVIDESHDPSFKQQSGFRYSARDVAVMRAHLENIPIILGTATPSLESLYNAQQERYHLLSLPERTGDSVEPSVSIVDLRHQSLQGGMSPILITKIKEHRARGGQVLLFLNRRGYAPTLLCHHCGWMVACSRCDARMTLHYSPKRLYCHHCGAQASVPSVCTDCHQSELTSIGLGTERLEATLTELFPLESIIRIDRDSTRKKGSLLALLEKIHQREANILIGTQMLSKGHHFPHLTLVAIVDADGGLYGTDFRAMERMAQLWVQVSGRAGRSVSVGEVCIQTHHPEHPLLNTLISKGYTAFSDALLKERQVAQLPPYSYLALLRAESRHAEASLNFLNKVKQQLSMPEAVLSLGPIPAPMEKRAGWYRAQLLLQSSRRLDLQKVCEHVDDVCSKISQRGSRNHLVRWSLDVDPQEML